MKDAEKERVGRLIGAVCVWAEAVAAEIGKGGGCDNDLARKMMKWHNDAGEEINTILNYPAVVLFNME